MVAKSAMAGNNVSIVKGSLSLWPGLANLYSLSSLDFPWKDIILGSTLCDVGSGVGAVSLDLAKAHPHLRITLKDQPQIIEWARDVRAAHHSMLPLLPDDSR